jgi:hypothetical protein
MGIEIMVDKAYVANRFVVTVYEFFFYIYSM